MRSLIALCLVAGCYKPATDSCYYACATQGTPCPSGLTCVAGMCSTGEVCDPIGGDGPMIDSGPDIDAPPPACGNNTATVGEICYDPALVFPSFSGNAPYDGILADRNNDSRLDLVYLTSSGITTHPNLGMALSTAGSQGPSINNARVMRPFQLDGTTGHELLIATDGALEAWQYSVTSLDYARAGMFSPIGQVTFFEFAKISDSPIGDVVVVDATTGTLELHRIDGPGTSTTLSIETVGIGQNGKVAVGQLTNDQRADVLLLSQVGVKMYTGTNNGLVGGPSLLGATSVADARIGDIDGDGDGDIVYVVASQGSAPMGQLGVILGDNSGTFPAPQITTLLDLGGAIELADLDSDGRQDVIVVRTGAQRALLVYRGRSDGMLELPVALPLPGVFGRISARGSFNGDTVPDIVVSDAQGNNVYVFPSNP
jgi:hypothetical protein